jgi:hypothetical protein
MSITIKKNTDQKSFLMLALELGGQNNIILWYILLNNCGDCNKLINSVDLPEPALPKNKVKLCLFINLVIS